jgi:hypothetical protein
MHDISWADADLTPFDPSNTDKAKIEAGHPVPCRLCEAVFRVLMLTTRYCSTCEQGYCQPSHGGWVGRRGACIQHGPHHGAPARASENQPGAPLNPVLKARMKARVEELRFEEQLRARWDSFCENCREPLNGREAWIDISGRFEDDDDPAKTYYCPKCIVINSTRRRTT